MGWWHTGLLKHAQPGTSSVWGQILPLLHQCPSVALRDCRPCRKTEFSLLVINSIFKIIFPIISCNNILSFLWEEHTFDYVTENSFGVCFYFTKSLIFFSHILWGFFDILMQDYIIFLKRFPHPIATLLTSHTYWFTLFLKAFAL